MDPDLARALIEDHARTLPGLSIPAPDTGGKGDAPVVRHARVVNPTCGDVVDLTVTVLGATVYLHGTVTGCALSRASGSLLGQAVTGAPVAAAQDLVRELVAARLAGRRASSGADVALLADLPVAPLRRRCILLPWTTAGDLLAAG